MGLCLHSFFLHVTHWKPLRFSLLKRLRAFLPCPPCWWGSFAALFLPPRGSRPTPGTQCVLMRESPNGRDMCLKSLPCPSELASRLRRRSACQSWDWGYTALHTAAWEAWGQPVDREQAMSGFARFAAVTCQQRSSPGRGGFLPGNSLSFQSEMNMVEALFPENSAERPHYLILFREALTLHGNVNRKAENW